MTILIVTVFILTFLSACGTVTNKQVTINGDIMETTKSIRDVPSYLTNDNDKDTKNIYVQVYNYKEVLKQIPPYDGSSYQNVYETFFYKENTDGSLMWNNHALKNGVALAVGGYASALAKSGKSLTEIQKEIEKKYKGVYGIDDPRRNYSK